MGLLLLSLHLPPHLQLLQLQQPPLHHQPAPQSLALLQALLVSSPSPSLGPPMCPAQSGSTGGRTRAASGAPPRWTARGFMSMERETMDSVGLTAILTPCLSQIFWRVLSGPMPGPLVRQTRTRWCLGTQQADLSKQINCSSGNKLSFIIQ